MISEPIILKPEWNEWLEESARREARSPNDLLNEALEYYFHARQREKLNQEIAAYTEMHTKLRETMLGAWVAIHQQKLVDHDSDRLALYRRIRAKYGRISVLLRQVRERSRRNLVAFCTHRKGQTMNFKYNLDYFPAAPHAEIRLGIPDESLKIGPLSAFVDSGADATIVPLRHIHALNGQAEDSKFMSSQWGERRQVDIYWLDLGIGDLRLLAVEIVGDDQGNEVILGRNVLNLLRVFMDGPKQIVEISE